MTTCVGPELRPETEVPIYTTGKLFLTHIKRLFVSTAILFMQL